MIAHFELTRTVYTAVLAHVVPRGVRRLAFLFSAGKCYLRVPLPRKLTLSNEFYVMTQNQPPNTLIIVSCNDTGIEGLTEKLVYQFNHAEQQSKFVQALEQITGVKADVK